MARFTTNVSVPSLPVYEEEVTELSACYGVPIRRHFDLETDRYMLETRQSRRHDRRAEVLFVVSRPNGKILLHTKRHYPPGVFRLFTGGIGLHESVLHALWREVEEETGLDCAIQRFLALSTYCFRKDDFVMNFATYSFHLLTDDVQVPQPRDTVEVAFIGETTLSGLPLVAQRLRSLAPEQRRVWGQWRAIGHDLSYEALSQTVAKEDMPC